MTIPRPRNMPPPKRPASGPKAPLRRGASATRQPRASAPGYYRLAFKKFVLALVLLLLAGAGAGALRAQNEPAPVKPAPADPAAALPHDSHEGLTILADPYVDKQRGKDKFGKANPLEVGILPVEVFLRNETDHPIQVDINTIQLEVLLHRGGKQDIDWLTAEDVAALIAHPGGVAPSAPRRIAGIPLPSGDKKTDKLAGILRPLTLDSDTVAPMGSLHGFLYFNVNHDPSLADTAVLYVPDVVIVPTKKPMLFFEVPLGKSPHR